MDIKQYLRTLSDEQWKQFTQSYGGSDSAREAVISEIRTAHLEQIACEKVLKLFGVKILTEAERAEDRAKVATEATVKQAQAAVEANRLAHHANEIATRADEKAERSISIAAESLKVAAATKFWTMAAAVVAVLALVVSLVSLFK